MYAFILQRLPTIGILIFQMLYLFIYLNYLSIE